MRVLNYLNRILLVIILLIPVFLLCNRVLVPDNSFDSINYHLFLGYRGWHSQSQEFYPTGIHNFSPILDMVNIPIMDWLGYRLGTILSVIYLYGCLLIVYLIYRLYYPNRYLTDSTISVLLFANTIFSFEIFLQIATYYTDIAVTFWMLFTLYLLLLYESTARWRYLFFSSAILAFVLVSKFTSWYILPPYFGYLVFVVYRSKLSLFNKLSHVITAMIISISLLVPWLWQNYQITNNPVFPFYNSIFMSDFFPAVNFEQTLFGGKTVTEKLLWGIVSATKPVRLGEVHDLYHDYKINIYFVFSIALLLIACVTREYKLRRFTLLYLALFVCWAVAFGYLRYGIVLEILGGLLLLMAYQSMRTTLIRVMCVLTLLILLLQDKRIVNMSLAYDISFRVNYFFNRERYLAEKPNLFDNRIFIDTNLLEEYKPSVYLNCAAPSMTYYVISNVNTLPVLNIALTPYADLVNNKDYQRRSIEKIGMQEQNFVTVVGSGGLINTLESCLESIENRDYQILKIIDGVNMLGYQGQKLAIIFGSLKH